MKIMQLWPMTRRNALRALSLGAIALALLVTACPGTGTDPVQEAPTGTGTVIGKALFANTADNSGIVITLEQSDGLRSASARMANHSLAARAAAATGTTRSDGTFTLDKIPTGSYTLYASSQNSLERAVTADVTVKADTVFDAGTLQLTPVGSISGKITVDGKTDNALGFLVSVAGTSFMAVTAGDGTFMITGIPAGSDYTLVVMKGNYTAMYGAAAITVEGGKTAAQATKNIASADMSSGSSVVIGVNGNWFIDGVDTNVKAQGEQGAKGDTGAQGAAGADGKDGKDAETIYTFIPGSKTVTVSFGTGVEPDLYLFNTIKDAFTGLSLSGNGQNGFDALIAAGLSVHITETGSLTIDVSGKKITIPVGSIGAGLSAALTTALDDEFYVAPKEGIMKRWEVPTYGGSLQDASGNPYGIRFRFIDGIEDENVINDILAKFEQAWTIGDLANLGVDAMRNPVFNRVLARGLKIRIESPAASYDYEKPIDYKTIAWHINYVLNASAVDLSIDLDYCILNEINEWGP